MPTVARLFVKASLVWMVLGVTLGGWLLLWPWVSGQAVAYPWSIVHAHILFVGFLMNMVMGVAYWMFPRPRLVPRREELSAAALILMNLGLALRVIGEPWAALGHGGVFAVVLL